MKSECNFDCFALDPIFVLTLDLKAWFIQKNEMMSLFTPPHMWLPRDSSLWN